MPKLDAQRQIDAKPRNGNGAVYITSGTPILAPNPAPVMAHSGTPGQWYIGPSTLLMQAVSSTDDSIVVADDYLLDIGDEIVLSDNRAINEIATVTGGPTAAGAYWRYTIGRTDGRSFLAGGTVTSLGTEADGGYIIVNSGERGGAASKAPHINIWERAAGGDLPKLRMGKLANLPAALKAEFPGVDAEEWAAAGYGIAAAGSAYFAGKVWAQGGQINGDMLIDGGTLKTLSGLGRAGVVMGENEIGYGITLQDSAGEPLFWAVSPYMEGGTVLSEVAVGIKAEGKRLLYLHKDPATDEYKLEIGVETLVDGQLQATNILAGTGTYPNAFTGMRFGAEGLQTFGTDFVEQVAIDVQDGRLYFGKREGWLGENGITIDARLIPDATDDLEHTINWKHTSSTATDYTGAAIGSRAGGELFMTARRMKTDAGIPGAWGSTDFVEAKLSLNAGDITYLSSDWTQIYGRLSVSLRAGDDDTAELAPGGRFTVPKITTHGDLLHTSDDLKTVSIGTNSATGARLISQADDIPVFRGLRSDGQYFAIDVRRASETWLSASGAIALLPAPGADGIGRVLPYSNPVGLGSAARKFWEVHAEKGHFGTLGSQTALAGQFYLTSKHATLAVGLEPENVVAYVREQGLVEGEFYRLEDVDGNHETIRVNTAGVLTGDGWYEYEIERAQGADLDNETGLARQWYAGDVGVSLGGNLTDGYIRLWGADDLNENTGPAIVVYQRDNDDAPGSVSERAVFGNLNGFYGYEENVYGVAFGRAAGRWVSLDDAEGLRIMQGDTQRAVYREYTMIGAEAGNNVYITDTSLQLRNGNTNVVELTNSAELILHAGTFTVTDDASREVAITPVDINLIGTGTNRIVLDPDNTGIIVDSDTVIAISARGRDGVNGVYSLVDTGIAIYGSATEEDGIGVLADGSNEPGSIALQISGGIVDGGSQRYTNLADATAATDALNRQTGDGRYMLASNEANYLLAAGTRTGATSQAQAFTNGIVGPTWKPTSDSTTALRMQNAAGSTTYLTVDSSGGWVSIGGTGIKMPQAGEIRSSSTTFWHGPFITTSAGEYILAAVPSHRTVQIGADPFDRYSAYTLGVKPATNMPALGVVAYASQTTDLVRFVDKNSQYAYQLTYDNIHNFLGNMNVGGRVSGSLGFDRLQGAGLRYTTTFTSCASSSVSIFDGSHSTGAATKINAATSGVIEVSFNPYVGWTANTNTGYTYIDGRLLITFFSAASCASNITVEVYRPSGGADGWVTAATVTGNTSSAVLINLGSSYVYIKKIKITLSHALQAVWIDGISYFAGRPENIAEMQVIPRYADEDIVLAADSVTWKDTAWTDRVKLAYNVADGGSAVGYIWDTTNALSTSGALLSSWRNNGTQKASIDKDGNINVVSGSGYKVNAVQVVGARGAAVADATDAATAITQLNTLLARLRTHGLIET